MTAPVPAPAGAAPDDLAPDPATLDAVQGALLRWFAQHGRDLPWRQTRDPYRILVSEVMLQQIQVPRAVPFYEAFIARFPTLSALAAAPLAHVIRVWGDLGRYRRLVNLHRTARLIVEEHGGIVPSDVAALRQLPGVGPYTAGAVACFAFDQDVAFLDTNMRRVLHRLFVGSDVPAPTVGERALQRLAAQAVPAGRGWDWNQGLMDFGATRCRARKPACAGCPLRHVCRAYPALQSDLAAHPVARGAVRPRYDTTNRLYRGRVLAALRDLPAGERAASLELRSLGTTVHDGFADDDLAWLTGVVESLAKDGLAIAEETPAYDAGGGTVRVRLP